jgi:ArsR family transcriptional regulator
MNESSAIAVFAALASEPRLRILRRLVQSAPEALPAGALAAVIDAPASSASFHLAALERAGIVRSRRASRSILYAADLAALQGLVGFLLEDCCAGRPDLCASVVADIENRRACACDQGVES